MFFCFVLIIEPKFLCMIGRQSTTDLCLHLEAGPSLFINLPRLSIPIVSLNIKLSVINSIHSQCSLRKITLGNLYGSDPES